MACVITFNSDSVGTATQTVHSYFSTIKTEPMIEALLSPYFPTWWNGDDDTGALIPA